MAGADTKLTVEADTSGAIRSVKNLEGAFASLKTQLLGLGIGAAVLQANNFALALDQASRASGVALGTVTSFARAVASLGGDANRAAGDIIDFVSGLDAAKKGSASAQVALAQIGVTLGDLSKLTNQELFEKTVQGIARIGDASTRNAMAVQMLGRSFKDIDVRDVAAKMSATSGGDTTAIKSAADAQKNLSVQFGNLQEALLKVIQPLNDIVKGINVSASAFESLIKVIIGFLSVWAIFYKAIPAVTAAMATFIGFMVNTGGVISAVSTGFGGLASGVLLIVSRFGRLFATTAAGVTPFTQFGAILFSIVRLFLRFAGIAGIVYTVVEAVNFLSKALFNFDILNFIGEKFSAIYETAKKFFGIVPKDAREGTRGRGDPREIENREKHAADLAKQKAESQQKIVDAFRAQRLEQEKIIAGYKQEINSGLRQLDFQNTLIGKTDEEKDKKSKLFELETTYISKINEILAKQAELKAAAAVGTKEEGAAYAAYSAAVQSTIGKLAEQYGIQVSAATKLIDQGQGLALLEKDRQNTLERITAQMEAQSRISDAMASARLKMGGETQDLTFQRGLIGFGNATKQRLTIVEESRKAGNEAARAYAAAFEGEDMTAAQAQQFADGLEAIREGYDEIRDLQLSNLAISQEWSAGWREAFQNYADEAENSARQASDYFSTFTKGFEDAIVNFVRTGKLSFKSLANSMIAEFAKIQAQKMFVSLFGGTGNAGGGLLGSFFSGLFGKAGGGAVNAGQAYMVGESGKELFVPNTAGRIMNGDMSGGSGMNITYNIQAVDASSFRTLVARDPQFIYNITEAGRRSQPSRRLA